MSLSNIKEFREFFLRKTQVSSGSKKDQESNFPTKETNAAGILKPNRFLDGDYPSENVFSKLFNSITFKLNPEDKATESSQGLAKVATESQIQDAEDDANFSAFVTPSQQPVVKAGNNVSVSKAMVDGHPEYTVDANAQSSGEDDVELQINSADTLTTSTVYVTLYSKDLVPGDLSVGTVIRGRFALKDAIGESSQTELKIINKGSGSGLTHIRLNTESSDVLLFNFEIVIGNNSFMYKVHYGETSTGAGYNFQEEVGGLVDHVPVNDTLNIQLRAQKAAGSSPLTIKISSLEILKK